MILIKLDNNTSFTTTYIKKMKIANITIGTITLTHQWSNDDKSKQ